MGDTGAETAGASYAEGDTLEEAIVKAHLGAKAQHSGHPDEEFHSEVVSLGYRSGGFAGERRFKASVKPIR